MHVRRGHRHRGPPRTPRTRCEFHLPAGPEPEALVGATNCGDRLRGHGDAHLGKRVQRAEGAQLVEAAFAQRGRGTNQASVVPGAVGESLLLVPRVIGSRAGIPGGPSNAATSKSMASGAGRAPFSSSTMAPRPARSAARRL